MISHATLRREVLNPTGLCSCYSLTGFIQTQVQFSSVPSFTAAFADTVAKAAVCEKPPGLPT